jgi:formate dehydrogenase assembly factor FdhD
MSQSYPMTDVELRGAYATVRAPGLEDEVAVEEPLEIRVDGRPLAVTMRTPGKDGGCRTKGSVRPG